MTADKGITVASGNTLNIYGQTQGTGKLTAMGNNNAAGIGGVGTNGGTTMISGGIVTATGGANSAGIVGTSGFVVIDGGTVTATGGSSSAQGISGSGEVREDNRLTTGSGIVVFGGGSPNPATDPTTVLFSPYRTRYQYMEAATGYIVSFDKNNDKAAGTMSPLGVRASSPDLTLPENTFTLTGYTFDHWNTESDDTGTSYADKAKITLSKNITLYAQWTITKYTLNYDLQGGTVAQNNPAAYNIESSDLTLVNPKKAGCTFIGWTGTSVDAASSKDVTIPAGSTGNRSYTANWSLITYTISYNLNGGTNNSANPTSYTVESATITIKAPTRDGYEFKGWTLDGAAVTEIPLGSMGDKTLTAVWASSGSDSGSDSELGFWLRFRLRFWVRFWLRKFCIEHRC